MRRLWWVLLLVGCSSKEQASPVDTGVEEEEDTAIVVPPLDPAKCGAVVGDEGLPFERAPYPQEKSFTAKLFPLARLLTDDERGKLAANTALEELAAASRARFEKGEFTWPAEEQTAAADAFVDTVDVAALATRMRASGAFHAYAGDDRALVRAAAFDLLANALSILASRIGELTSEERSAALEKGRAPGVYFAPVVAAAEAVLAAAERDEGVRYEPLHLGENAAAFNAIKDVDFAKYPFAAILVPGLGGSDKTTPLVEGGRIRAGVAPVIILSGGHVHPDRTPFSEAIEMKKYLRAAHDLPERALLVDPHARHTTTNVRNASRLLLRYGFPLDKPVLITTDAFQSLYIIGRPFAVRCREELGYEPFRKLASLSINDSCFFPSRKSLHLDARDPLDP